jgi:hypothetical protein
MRYVLNGGGDECVQGSLGLSKLDLSVRDLMARRKEWEWYLRRSPSETWKHDPRFQPRGSVKGRRSMDQEFVGWA